MVFLFTISNVQFVKSRQPHGDENIIFPCDQFMNEWLPFYTGFTVTKLIFSLGTLFHVSSSPCYSKQKFYDSIEDIRMP